MNLRYNKFTIEILALTFCNGRTANTVFLSLFFDYFNFIVFCCYSPYFILFCFASRPRYNFRSRPICAFSCTKYHAVSVPGSLWSSNTSRHLHRRTHQVDPAKPRDCTTQRALNQRPVVYTLHRRTNDRQPTHAESSSGYVMSSKVPVDVGLVSLDTLGVLADRNAARCMMIGYWHHNILYERTLLATLAALTAE